MKKLIFIQALIIVALIFYTVKCTGPKDPVEIESSTPKEAREAVSADVKKINCIIDSKGLTHAIFDDRNNVIRDAGLLNDSSKIWKDSVIAVLGISKNDKKTIQELTTINQRLKADRLVATETDTGFYYRDKWANIELVKPSAGVKPTPGYFNIQYNAELNYARVRQKGGLFKKDKTYIDMWLSDGRATINGFKTFKIEEPQPNKNLTVAPVAKAQLIRKDIVAGVGGEINYKTGPINLRYDAMRVINPDELTLRPGWVHTATITVPIINIKWYKE